MGQYMRDASLSFAAARFAAGDNLPYVLTVQRQTFITQLQYQLYIIYYITLNLQIYIEYSNN